MLHCLPLPGDVAKLQIRKINKIETNKLNFVFYSASRALKPFSQIGVLKAAAPRDHGPLAYQSVSLNGTGETKTSRVACGNKTEAAAVQAVDTEPVRV